LPTKCARALLATNTTHANRYTAEKHPYAIERYTAEAKRLLGVLEARLLAVGAAAGDGG
jgi:hypothetical protein